VTVTARLVLLMQVASVMHHVKLVEHYTAGEQSQTCARLVRFCFHIVITQRMMVCQYVLRDGM